MKPALTKADADRVAAAALAAAAAQGWKVTVLVTDDAGHALRLDRVDGAAKLSLRVAQQKADTVVELDMTSRALGDMAKANAALLAIPGLAPFAGGVPLRVDGVLVGAVAVSGVTADQDEQVALAGAAAL